MFCAKFGARFGRYSPGGSGEDFKILSIYFRYFIIISPLKRMWSFIWKKTWTPFTKGCFVPGLVKIGPVFLDLWKGYKQTNRQTTENRGSEIRAFSSGEQNKSFSKMNLFKPNWKWLKQWFILLQLKCVYTVIKLWYILERFLRFNFFYNWWDICVVHVVSFPFTLSFKKEESSIHLRLFLMFFMYELMLISFCSVWQWTRRQIVCFTASYPDSPITMHRKCQHY